MANGFFQEDKQSIIIGWSIQSVVREETLKNRASCTRCTSCTSCTSWYKDTIYSTVYPEMRKCLFEKLIELESQSIRLCFCSFFTFGRAFTFNHIINIYLTIMGIINTVLLVLLRTSSEPDLKHPHCRFHRLDAANLLEFLDWIVKTF